MMHKLIVVRHGEYGGEGGSLTERGRQQISALAALLLPIVNGSTSVVILSSTARRAKETSEILGSCLGGLKFELHEFLLSGAGMLSRKQEAEALALVADKGASSEVVILSTHLEFIDEFPKIWGKSHNLSIPSMVNTAKGSARVVDTQTGDVRHLRPQL